MSVLTTQNDWFKSNARTQIDYKKRRRIMEITREELLRKVAEESGFYQKHVRTVFSAIEKVVLECF